jgi:phospho-N-acetylmuramoyl-pentapeptide-transferase
MGDTGSLFFGALVIGTALVMNRPIVGLIVSALFIIEMLSSFLQIFYFKLTHGKRLFRMAPLHHHFEKCGWGENKIVFVFSAVELLFCILAFLMI